MKLGHYPSVPPTASMPPCYVSAVVNISRHEVERIASLARLSLSEEELTRMTRDLEAILDYVESLQELDTTDIEPTAHAIPIPTPLREDRVGAGLLPELAIANAPECEGTAFRVPRVIEEDEG